MNDSPLLIRVLLAGDHNVARQRFRALLDDTPDIKVVAETNKGQDVFRLIGENSPNVVVLDIAMAGNVLEIASKVGEDFPDLKVVIISMHVSESEARCAGMAGAASHHVKDSAESDLEAAIRAVMRGEVFMSPVVSRYLFGLARSHDKASSDQKRLTDRQCEVLRRIA